MVFTFREEIHLAYVKWSGVRTIFDADVIPRCQLKHMHLEPLRAILVLDIALALAATRQLPPYGSNEHLHTMPDNDLLHYDLAAAPRRHGSSREPITVITRFNGPAPIRPQPTTRAPTAELLMSLVKRVSKIRCQMSAVPGPFWC